MISKQLALLILFSNFILFASCQQKMEVKSEPKIEEKVSEKKARGQHPYGGWSCPDNVFGFPAVNIKELDKVPVVDRRLPTKEETQNGISLMYFPPEKHPKARALDIKLPKLARYYSKYTKKNELVIVIQAVVENQDTVAGFRYLNGGNGSDWYSELDFISDEEISNMQATPFVSKTIEINASKSKIWTEMTKPILTNKLGQVFEEKVSVSSNWKQSKKSPLQVVNNGIVTTLWEDTYVQIDYDVDGRQSAEKLLLSDNKESNTTNLNIVAGPYGKDFDSQQIIWDEWLFRMKKLSEK